MLRKALLLAALLAVLATACGGEDAPAPTAAPTPAPPPPSAQSVVVQVAASGLGDILTDGDGNTLYLFMPDNQSTPGCNAACAEAWPPLMGEPAAGAGVNSSLLGTVSRQDGTTQAIYNSWPLYYFGGDPAAGDTNGQGLNEVWFVLDPAGEGAMPMADASPTRTATRCTCSPRTTRVRRRATMTAPTPGRRSPESPSPEVGPTDRLSGRSHARTARLRRRTMDGRCTTSAATPRPVTPTARASATSGLPSTPPATPSCEPTGVV